MNLKSFTLVVTDDCNYDCVYCPQNKESNYIDKACIEKSVDFFYPFMDKDECGINFYGGEPLLAFDMIRHAVSLLEIKNKSGKKNLTYSMTINGSLLNDEIEAFLNLYKFSLQLSFDGLAHDLGREKDSFDFMKESVERLLTYPDIKFSTNSVFTPATVGYLADSIRLIYQMGVKEPRLALSTVEEWDDDALDSLRVQLTELKDFQVPIFKETRMIPVSEFRVSKEKGVFGCFAAQDRMSVSTDGKVWGCFLFHDFFKDKRDTREYKNFFLGELDDFIQNHLASLKKLQPNYINLYQKNFYTPNKFCATCEELSECKTCPVNAALSGSILLGKIPPWICKINKLKKEIRTKFHQEIAAL
ncbi:MAG: radical SAM protein [bacterium]|nr:radical SAM protein [bacterium]